MRLRFEWDFYCQNAVMLMPAVCSLFTEVPLPGDWWCRNGLACDSIALDERWSRVTAWCIALLPCNVFALLSNCCGGEWLNGWCCRPANERTCNNRPLFNSRAWCSCALARRHAIELFLHCVNLRMKWKEREKKWIRLVDFMDSLQVRSRDKNANIDR